MSTDDRRTGRRDRRSGPPERRGPTGARAEGERRTGPPERRAGTGERRGSPGRGRRTLRRFARVSALVTGIDVAVLVGARRAGLAVVAADAVAVGLASVSSFTLHRRVTFGDDPHVRWVHRPGVFAATAVGAGAVDVALVGLLGSRGGTPRLLGAKGVALGAAATVRLLAYRSALLPDVRRTLAGRAERPPPPGDVRLSVVVPAFGEGERIRASVAAIRADLAHVEGDGGLEVVVVDDGSPDATAAEAAAAGAVVVRLPANRGKGAAVRAGVLASRGRCVAFIDADLAYPPRLLGDLLAAVEGGSDVAVGNRFHPGSQRPPGSFLRSVSGRLFNVLTAAVLLGQHRDTQCGLKAFRADVARQIFTRTRLDGFAFDVEVLHLVERDRLSMTEVPVTLVTTTGSTVRVALDAARMVRDLLRVRRWAGRGGYDLPAGPPPVPGGPATAPAGAATTTDRPPPGR